MKKVLLLLAEGFESLMAFAFIDVLGRKKVDVNISIQLFTCGLRREIVNSDNQRVTVDYLVYEVDPGMFEALIIPGGFEKCGFYSDAYDESILMLIRMFDARNKIIASVCVGALPIALSGILSTHKIIDDDKKTPLQIEQEKTENVISGPVVFNSNVIISWKPSTAFEVAYLLLERLTTKEYSNFIRKMMEFRMRQN